MNSRVLQLSIAAGAIIVVGFLSPLGELQAADEPIVKITRGLPDVSRAASSADRISRCYGLAYPVQVGPTTAALFCNLRTIGPNRHDYEDGTDVFLFDNLGCVGRSGPMSISRNEKDPKAAASRFIMKGPVAGGFWPLGAKRLDGSPHPGAGRGFAFCNAGSFAGSGDTLIAWDQSFEWCVELLQLTFDGQRISVIKRDLFQSERLWTTPDGWQLLSAGLHTAIPDGDDLLLAVCAKKDGIWQTGVCSFRYRDGSWQPVVFTPVARYGYEPTLVRCNDNSLVFGVRPTVGGEGNSVMLWGSTDGGKTWKQTLNAKNARTESPVTVNATPDGRIFVAANVLGAKRTQLAIWPVTEGATKLGLPCVIRDCQKEFGPLPNGINWYADHPISATLRLSDGRWHGVIAYRVVAFPNVGKVEPIMPQTGCCLEKMTSAQPVSPPWRF